MHAAQILPLQVFDVPLELPPGRIFMIWHERVSDDPGNVWLRELTARCTGEVSGVRAAKRGEPTPR